MRKLFIALFLLSNLCLSAQELAESKNTFLNLLFSTSSLVINQLDGKKASYASQKEAFQESQKYLKALLEEYTVNTLYTELETQKGIRLEEKNALKEYLTYAQGLPLVLIPKSAIKKLKKRGYQSDHYFSFTISVDHDILGATPYEVAPRIKCTLKVFNANRETVKKIEEKYQPETIIKKRDFEDGFSKFNSTDMEKLAEKLKPILHEGIIAAINQL